MRSVGQILHDFERLDPSEQTQFQRALLGCGCILPPPWAPLVPANAGIEATAEVCGGVARIVRMRIPVWMLEQMRQFGVSEAEILRSYPTLRAEDLVHAWAYVDLHRAEIDEPIRANEED